MDGICSMTSGHPALDPKPPRLLVLQSINFQFEITSAGFVQKHHIKNCLINCLGLTICLGIHSKIPWIFPLVLGNLPEWEPSQVQRPLFHSNFFQQRHSQMDSPMHSPEALQAISQRKAMLLISLYPLVALALDFRLKGTDSPSLWSILLEDPWLHGSLSVWLFSLTMPFGLPSTKKSTTSSTSISWCENGSRSSIFVCWDWIILPKERLKRYGRAHPGFHPWNYFKLTKISYTSSRKVSQKLTAPDEQSHSTATPYTLQTS